MFLRTRLIIEFKFGIELFIPRKSEALGFIYIYLYFAITWEWLVENLDEAPLWCRDKNRMRPRIWAEEFIRWHGALMTANGGGDEMLRGSGRSYDETWRGVQRVKDVLRTRAFCVDGSILSDRWFFRGKRKRGGTRARKYLRWHHHKVSGYRVQGSRNMGLDRVVICSMKCSPWFWSWIGGGEHQNPISLDRKELAAN